MTQSDTPRHEDLVEQIAAMARSMNGTTMHFDTEITADTDILRDLRLDSLAAMDFMMAVELRFDTMIPVDAMTEVRTVGELATLLQSQDRQAAAA